MAKKRRRKKLSLKKKRLLRRKKKIRRLLLQVALLSTGIAAGVLAKPSLLTDPVQRAKVEEVRDQVLEANDEAQEKALEVLGDSSQAVKGAVDTVSEISQGLTGTDHQAVVQEKVASITEEIKELPEKQVKKIKLEFCEDLIKEIELTCEAQ